MTRPPVTGYEIEEEAIEEAHRGFDTIPSALLHRAPFPETRGVTGRSVAADSDLDP